MAGIEPLKSYIIEVIKMMQGDERYKNIGAKPPKVKNILKKNNLK